MKVIEAIKIRNERDRAAQKEVTAKIKEQKRLEKQKDRQTERKTIRRQITKKLIVQENIENFKLPDKKTLENREWVDKMNSLVKAREKDTQRSGRPVERRARRIYRICPCGRTFSVLTGFKSENRRICRVCKP